MKLKSIKIEGMNNVDSCVYTLEDANCFIGPNGSGKTTAMQAIQLALLGYTSSSGKQISGIMRHSNNHTMAVTATLEGNGTTIEVQRIFSRSGKSNKSTLNISPDGYGIDEFVKELELPIFNFSDLMSDTANSQKSWWMKTLPPCDTSVDWKKEFDDATKESIIYQKEDILEELIQRMTISGVGSSGIQSVQSANDFLKAELSAEKKTSQQLEDTLRSLIHYDDVETGTTPESLEIELNRLEKERMRLAKYLVEQTAYESQKESRDRQIESLSKTALSKESLDQKKSELVEQREHLVKMNESILSLKKKKAHVLAEIDALLKMKEASMCPVLHIQCDKLGTDSTDSTEKHSELVKESDLIQSRLSELELSYSEELTRYNNATDEYNSALSARSNLDAIKKTPLNVPETINMGEFQCKSEEEYDSTISSMRNLLHKVIANQSYSELYEKVKNDTLLSQSRIALLKLLISHTDVNSLQNRLMSKQFEQFESQMAPFIQAVMGDNCSPKFHLTEKSSDFSFGIQRNSAYIPYSMLSSGEKCMFALAMMVSIVSMSSSELKLVMIDDMLDHLDSEKLKAVIQGIHSVENIQFIFAGVMDVSSEDINIIHV